MITPTIMKITPEQRVILDSLTLVIEGSTAGPSEGISFLITLLWEINNTYKAEGQDFETFIANVTTALRQLELAHGTASDKPN